MDIGGDARSQNVQIKYDLGEKCQKLFCDFLAEFTNQPDETQPKYADNIHDLLFNERNTLYVSLEDVQQFDSALYELILEDFYRIYPYLCRGLVAFVKDETLRGKDEAKIKQIQAALKKKDLYVGFYDVPIQMKIRELKASSVGTLRRISGQVVRTHPVHPELISGTFECIDCSTEVTHVPQQFKFTQPAVCRNELCANRSRFKLIVNKSRFVDFQKVRIQETQAEIPRGSMPRSLDIIFRGAEQVDCIQPGERCDFIGTLIVVPDVGQMFTAQAGQIRTEAGLKSTDNRNEGITGLKALGVKEMSYKLAFLANCAIREGSLLPAAIEELNKKAEEDKKKKRPNESMLNETDLSEILEMARDNRLYDNLIASLFPSIYGHDDIKRGLLLQLFSGNCKVTEEGTHLRGDINICIVGDPSTAKSCFLKLITDSAPIKAVYTSGKASTAAGLTAAVVRDEEGGFVIEAGALMLADRGVCCIDEFDKMDIRDQVAIHEAMEQQTISIAKAGVKATLNARASILAAANPIGGHYDRSRSLRNNLSLSLPIMSRFDLFFVLLDDANEHTDREVARKIVEMHADAFEQASSAQTTIYSLEQVRNYIREARKLTPKITPEAEIEMVETYKTLRGDKGHAPTGFAGNNRQSWRITVRQLESLIRLSEALAKLHFSDTVDVQHVKEAARLLNKSIVRVERPVIALGNESEADFMGDGSEPMQTDQSSNIITSEEYDRITINLVTILQRVEEERLSGLDDDQDVGMREDSEGLLKSELIAKYLEMQEYESEEQLAEKKTIVEKVIDRLVRQDRILMTALASQDVDTADPILVVNPNYSVE